MYVHKCKNRIVDRTRNRKGKLAHCLFLHFFALFVSVFFNEVEFRSPLFCGSWRDGDGGQVGGGFSGRRGCSSSLVGMNGPRLKSFTSDKKILTFIPRLSSFASPCADLTIKPRFPNVFFLKKILYLNSSPKFLPIVNVVQGLFRHLEDRAVLRAKAAALWARTKKISVFFIYWRNMFSLVVLKNLSVRASL